MFEQNHQNHPTFPQRNTKLRGDVSSATFRPTGHQQTDLTLSNLDVAYRLGLINRHTFLEGVSQAQNLAIRAVYTPKEHPPVEFSSPQSNTQLRWVEFSTEETLARYGIYIGD